MKIHFFGSLAGNKLRKGKKTNYERIVEAIEALDHEVITKHYLKKDTDTVLKESDVEHKEYFNKMRRWIRKADIVVVEVTKPEIGTGYEVALAVNMGKPVIAFYTEGEYSPIFVGQGTQQVQHLEYDSDNIKEVLNFAIEEAKNQMDVRFNFFISPEIAAYLDWVSKEKRVPRAVFLRRLIKEHMRENDDYPGRVS